ncbi:hypothetical protein OF83DRAFT_1111472 [Amylostereum chailletii]|nr:hypothetical protein OF83DRAFT_1111472 [Amylostereum chailletii]
MLSSRTLRTPTLHLAPPCRRSLDAHFQGLARPSSTSPVKPTPIPSRLLSTNPASSIGKNGIGIRVSTLFYALLALGLSSTAYGLYDFYATFTMWPEEIRGDLRAGVKAKHQGDFALSERFLRRAYDTALTLDLDKFHPSPFLKISGIAVLLGEVLEANERPETAYETYSAAHTFLQKHRRELAGPERLRAVAIAHKLGEMADTYQLGNAEQERWLTWAVEEVLKIAKMADKKSQKKRPANEGDDTEGDAENRLVLAELELPKWVTAVDIGAPIESLGQFYAKTGKIEFAVPLYLQAVSLLIPPPDSHKVATSDELCKGALLMSNMSELFMRGAATPESMHQAEAWAGKALSIVEGTRAKAGVPVDTCEQVLAVTLFNIASIHEMAGDPVSAREHFQRSWDQSNEIGLREGAVEAKAALRRLDRLQQHATPLTPDSQSAK